MTESSVCSLDSDSLYGVVPQRSFHEIFWDIIRTYTGHSCVSLNNLLTGGAKLSGSLQVGSAFADRAVCPSVPPQLCLEGVVPRQVPMEDLPLVTCCEDATTIVRLRAYCFKYGESVAQLLTLERQFSGRWGCLALSDRECLHKAIQQEKNARFCEDDLRSCFTDLRILKKGLCSLTPDVALCTNLTTLVLRNNPQLTSIPYLPPSCLVLLACGCSIREVCGSTSLVLLGLSYNAVDQLDFLVRLPALRVLDLTRNAVFSIDAATEALRRHPALVDVTFIGCPIALADGYSERLLSACPRLQRLDHVAALRCGDGAAVGDAPAVSLSVELRELRGLCSLGHAPVLREELPGTARSEPKGAKGRRKVKPAAAGLSYDFATSLCLRGVWGGRGGCGGAAVACEDLRLGPSAAALAQQGPRRRAQAAPPPVEDARALGSRAARSLPPARGLAEALAEPLVLQLELRDDVGCASGRSATLSCDVGAFFFDASSLLLSAAPPPRRLTVSAPLTTTSAAVEETRLRAREFRDEAAAALADVSVLMKQRTNTLALNQTGGIMSGRSKRRGRSIVNRSNCVQETNFGELIKKREEDVEELNLLASIADRRAEELQRLALVMTVEFSLGSAPKTTDDDTANAKPPKKGKTVKIKR